MPDLTRTLTDGLILSILVSIILLGSFLINPRIWLNKLPKEVQALVPPKTAQEKRLTLLVAIPFMMLLFGAPLISTLLLKNRAEIPPSFWALFLNAFGVVFTFNVFDWLILDWLLVCTITPRFMLIPGTEGHPAYKNYYVHFRGFLIGTVLSLVSGLIIAGVVWLL